MKTDDLFKDPHFMSEGFSFDHNVAEVFDNMAARSIPQYVEIQKMIVALACDYALPSSVIYDLGCSTGATLERLVKHCEIQDVRYVGIDLSQEMLTLARQKLASLNAPITLKQQDLSDPVMIDNGSVVILNLVLQFLPYSTRESLLQSIFQSLRPRGIVIIVEKIIPEYETHRESFASIYHHYKAQNGYTKEEIQNKSQSLQNRLLPLGINQNIERLKKSGFSEVETFFQWFNFVGIVAHKNK
jgi:tRNA (cmo5U34)-methyltransferase